MRLIQNDLCDRLRAHDEGRERAITEWLPEFEQKYDFANSQFLKNFAKVSALLDPDSPGTSRVKSADKMVMIPTLFDSDHPEKAKQHYERFNQYITFQVKNGNIIDPTKEAIDLFEHTLDKKALVWFQGHKAEFKDLTKLKNLFLSRYNPWGETKHDQLQSQNNLSFDSQKTDVDEQIDLVFTLGDMLGQEGAKVDKLIKTMPILIQTHLVTEKTWAAVTKKAKELKHIIQKCEPPVTASTSMQAAAVPKPFKSTKGRGGKKSVKGKQKQQQQQQQQQPQQQKPPPPPIEKEIEQYDETGNYYHNDNYQGHNRGHRPYRGQGGRKKTIRGNNSRGRGQKGYYCGQF